MHYIAIHSTGKTARALQSDGFGTEVEAQTQLNKWKAKYPRDDFTVTPCSCENGFHTLKDRSLINL